MTPHAAVKTWVAMAVLSVAIAHGSRAQELPAAGRFSLGVAFDSPSPLSANALLVERLTSPRTRARLLARMTRAGASLDGYPLEAREGRYAVYVPKTKPSLGYGLLVFIAPWEDGRLPQGWKEVLDKEGIIFVSAQRSGNNEGIIERRIPLALNGEHGIARTYELDPERILVGGFSGGSRVAARIALAYPDIFSGALLDAGSDPLGGPDAPLPAEPLLRLLQTHTRFAFVTGADDPVNVTKDEQTRLSFSRWCIDRYSSIEPPHVGHEIARADILARALEELTTQKQPDQTRWAGCISRMATRVDQARVEAARLRSLPPSSAVGASLDRLDDEFGNLIPPGPPAP